MTGLKTLKDIWDKYYRKGMSIACRDELKQEAIKRIKKIRKDFEKGTAGQTEDYNFMDFFNIEEKDLK